MVSSIFWFIKKNPADYSIDLPVLIKCLYFNLLSPLLGLAVSWLCQTCTNSQTLWPSVTREVGGLCASCPAAKPGRAPWDLHSHTMAPQQTAVQSYLKSWNIMSLFVSSIAWIKTLCKLCIKYYKSYNYLNGIYSDPCNMCIYIHKYVYLYSILKSRCVFS